MGRRLTRVSVPCEQCGKPSPLNAKRYCSRACFTIAKTTPAEERFWPKVNRNGPIHPALGTRCWLWTGSTDPKGYGIFWLPSRTGPAKAHRMAWTLSHGQIPDIANVLHRCDNPPCVNPDHLFLGTLADNNHDMKQKGRARGGGSDWPHTHAELMPRGEAHGMSKLTTDKVRQIRLDHAAGTTFAELSRRFYLDIQTVRRAAMRHTWKHVK